MKYNEWKSAKRLLESFKLKDRTKVVTLITSYMSKKLGHKFMYSLFEETAMVGDKDLIGISFYSDDMKRFRLFWEKGDFTNFNFWCADVWSSGNEYPDYFINLEGLNINIVLSLVNTCLLGKVNDVEMAKSYIKVTFEEEQQIQENLNKFESEELSELLKQSYFSMAENFYDVDKIPQNTLQRIANLVLKKEGNSTGTNEPIQSVSQIVKEESPVVQTVSKEQESMEVEFAKSSKMSDVGKAFEEDLTVMLNSVVENIQPSIILAGTPGIGKTFSVNDILSNKYGLRKNKDFVVYGGNISPFGLYTTLYKWKDDKIVVLDDIDSVFKSDSSILKNVLDSSEVRTVSWLTKNSSMFDPKGLTEEQYSQNIENGKIPNTFQFTSSVIFITNLDVSKLDDAVITRSLVMSLVFTKDQVLERIKELLPKIQVTSTYQLTIEEKQDILNVLWNSKNIIGEEKEVSLRTFINMAKQYISVKTQSFPVDWRILALKYS